MSSVQGAYLLEVCRRAGGILEARRAALAVYAEAFRDRDVVQWIHPAASVEGNGYLCVVRTPQPVAKIAAGLRERGIGYARIYPRTVADQPAAHGAIQVGALAHSRRFCEEVINLPLYYGIPHRDCVRAASTLLELVGA